MQIKQAPQKVHHKSFGPVNCGWSGEFFHLTVRGGMLNKENAELLLKELQTFLEE